MTSKNICHMYNTKVRTVHCIADVYWNNFLFQKFCSFIYHVHCASTTYPTAATSLWRSTLLLLTNSTIWRSKQSPLCHSDFIVIVIQWTNGVCLFQYRLKRTNPLLLWECSLSIASNDSFGVWIWRGIVAPIYILCICIQHTAINNSFTKKKHDVPIFYSANQTPCMHAAIHLSDKRKTIQNNHHHQQFSTCNTKFQCK